MSNISQQKPKHTNAFFLRSPAGSEANNLYRTTKMPAASGETWKGRCKWEHDRQQTYSPIQKGYLKKDNETSVKWSFRNMVSILLLLLTQSWKILCRLVNKKYILGSINNKISTHISTKVKKDRLIGTVPTFDKKTYKFVMVLTVKCILAIKLTDRCIVGINMQSSVEFRHL